MAEHTTLTPEAIIKIVQEKKLKSIMLWFSDVEGALKSIDISLLELENVLKDGKFMDGSSIRGFSHIEESDLLLIPDVNTFAVLPESLTDESTARMICSVVLPDGTPYHSCPRQALKRAIAKAREQGYTFYCGPELEFFLFRNASGKPECLDSKGYFDIVGGEEGDRIRKRIVETLEDMGIPCEASHHEVAPSQHEIGMRYQDGLIMADQIMTYRFIAKTIAKRYGVYASFMPKPIFGENGSGMHVHQSLGKDGKNAFSGNGDDSGLSPVAKGYMAGLMKYAREFTLVTNQWVNSYKRLVPGYEAPVYVAWGRRNRSALIRIPAATAGKNTSRRIEFRGPDPACNPYLAFAALLSAGMRGIQESLPLASATEQNIYEMLEVERTEHGIASLPGSLKEAVDEAKSGTLLKDLLGQELFKKLINLKEEEWNNYRRAVTDYEINCYYDKL